VLVDLVVIVLVETPEHLLVEVVVAEPVE